MTTPTFTPVNPLEHHDALLALNVQYLTWLAAAIDAHFGINSQAASGMMVTEYVASVLDTICGESPPPLASQTMTQTIRTGRRSLV
jgi:hypothetical protein